MINFASPFDQNPLALALAMRSKQESAASSSEMEREMAKMYAQQLLQSAGDTSPIQSHWQGAARLANGLIGGMQRNGIIAADRAQNAAIGRELFGGLGASAPTAAPAAAALPSIGPPMSDLSPVGAAPAPMAPPPQMSPAPGAAPEQQSAKPDNSAMVAALLGGGVPSVASRGRQPGPGLLSANPPSTHEVINQAKGALAPTPMPRPRPGNIPAPQMARAPAPQTASAPPQVMASDGMLAPRPPGSIPNAGRNPVMESAQAVAQATGLPLNNVLAFGQIESSLNPNAKTGSYGGLWQLDTRRFGNAVYDPQKSANIFANSLQQNAARYEKQFGKKPGGAELYFMHQQGPAGATAHWSNPDGPAWENFQRASGWSDKMAKKAIWGNMPGDVRRQFGSVDNVTSGDFWNVWQNKFNRFDQRFAGGPQFPGGKVPMPPPRPPNIPQGPQPMPGQEQPNPEMSNARVQLASLGGHPTPDSAPMPPNPAPAGPQMAQLAQATPGQPRIEMLRVRPQYNQGQPQTPQVNPAQRMQPQVPPAVLQKAQRLWGMGSRGQAMAMELMQPYLKPPSYGFQTLPDGTIIRTDPSRGTVEPIYQAQPKATFGDIGVDPTTGQPMKGFIDPSKRQVDPYRPPGGPPANSAIPPVPPGVDPKQWNEFHSKRVAENSAPANSDEVTKLRKEVQDLPSYKNIAQAAPIYKSMLDSAGRNSRASDLNLVYGLGKIFDPGSVVREGELVMVRNTASLPDWLKGAINQVNGGAELQPATREAIMREAHSRMQSYDSAYGEDAWFYRGIGSRRGVGMEDIIPPMGPFQPYQAKKPEEESPGGWRDMGNGVRVREKQ